MGLRFGSPLCGLVALRAIAVVNAVSHNLRLVSCSCAGPIGKEEENNKKANTFPPVFPPGEREERVDNAVL